MVSFLFVFGSFWLAWFTTGFPVLSTTFELDTGTGGKSISLRSSRSRVSLSLDVAVGEEDELEEDVEQCLACLESVIEVDESDPEDEFADNLGTQSERSSPCCTVSESRFE